MTVHFIYGDGVSRSYNYTPIPKREILAMAKNWKFGSEEGYEMPLSFSKVANLYVAASSLNNIYRTIYHGDWNSFSATFAGWRFYATADLKVDNLIIVPPRKSGYNLVVLVEGTAPNAVFYTKVLEGKGSYFLDARSRVLYDTHWRTPLIEALNKCCSIS